MGVPTARGSALLVVAAAVLWGTAGAAQELGPPGIAPPAVAALRSLLGGGLLVLVVVVAGRGTAGLTAVWRRARGAAVAGAVAMATFQVGYFGGIRLTGVAIGTLVAIGSAPVTAGLLDLLRGRRPGLRWVLATAVTVTGTALLLLPEGDDVVRPAGVALALVAGAAYASYAVASKRMLDAGVGATDAMAVAFVGAALLLAPVLGVVDVTWVATPAGAAVVVWLGVVTIALGYVLFARGLQGLQAATATTLTLAEPLTAALLAVLLLAERLVGSSLVGAVLIGAGLALASRADPGPQPEPARGGTSAE